MKNIELSLIMKTNRILAFFTVVLMAFALTSCVQDDDFSVPSSLGNEENSRLVQLLATSTMITIDEAKAMYDNDPNNDGDNADALPFYVENNIYVKGYVTSSDQTGNFYKEFFIQDAPSNPTTGLKIILNQVDTYNQFNKGREVYINLKGLYIGEERTGNNVFTIGGGTETDQYGTTVTQLSQNQVGTNLLRSDVTMELAPIAVGFSEISDDHIGLFVQVNDAEFADNLNGLRYYNPAEDFDTQRTMQTCSGFDYSTFPLETSSFASFKEELLPTGNGTIKAVVSKTYDASSLILALNTTDDVDFNSSRCELLNIDDFQVIMSEDFQSATNNTNLNIPGWTNVAEEGSWVWREKVFSGNGYAEFSTYNSGSNVNIAWLVSPGIDVDAQDVEFLNFKTAQHHLESVNNTLEIFVSTDFDGSDVFGATWEPISATLPTQATSWYEFVDSGLIDLSSYSGTLYVAFKVTGSGTDLTLDGAYQIDDFTVLGEI